METVTQEKYEPVIGVDIGPDAIRVVEIERISNDYYLRNFGIAPTPSDCMKDGRITKPREIGRIIKELFKERGFTHRTVVSAVRGAKVASRIITLPAMPHDRLRRLIESEIDRYVLFGNEDKIVNYHPLEEFEEHGKRRVAIILVIAERELCNSYFDTIEEAGLDCSALDLSSFSILRVLKNNMASTATENVMSVVYDYQGISLNVFHGDTIRYSRTVKLSRLDPMEMQNGFLDKILSEILLAMHYYQAEYSRGGAISKMLLSLGATGGMDLYHMLSEHIENIPIEMHTPFANIRVNVDEFPSELMDKVDLSFLTSVGLAMRGIEVEQLPFSVDLLPTEMAEFSALRVFATWILIAMVLIAGAFSFLWYTNNEKVKELQTQKQDLLRQTDHLNSKMNDVAQSELKLMQTAAVQASDKTTVPLNNLLAELSFVTPKTVQFEEMKLELQKAGHGKDGVKPGEHLGYTVEISGFALEKRSIMDFAKASSSVFTDPPKNPTPEDVRINENTVSRFELKGDWKQKQ